VTADAMGGAAMPASVYTIANYDGTACTPDLHDTMFATAAACINDDTSLPQAEKELRLLTLFKEQGIELEFVGL
jgi:hypothetical protein